MNFQNSVGQILGQYELKELLGIGGMGAVYRAHQKTLNREVAVKVLPPILARESGYVERFNREAETAGALQHPHIVPIVDYGTQQGTSYIVMRLLTGSTLADRLRQRQGEKNALPSLGEISTLLNQLAAALDYAHSEGVIHRDIKTSNIMFDNQGNAYITDFGIAKLAGTSSELTGSGMTMGTSSYMPPEQWSNQELTGAADQYALGVMIYALVTGRVPFEAPTPFQLMSKHLNEAPTPPHSFRNDVPEAVTLVLNRALAKRPEDRFPTVTAFAQAFAAAIEGHHGDPTDFYKFKVKTRKIHTGDTASSGNPIPVSGSVSVVMKPWWQNPVIWGIGVVIVLLAGILAVLLAPPGTPTGLDATLTAVAQVLTPVTSPEATEPVSGDSGSVISVLPTDTPTDLPTVTLIPSETDDPILIAQQTQNAGATQTAIQQVTDAELTAQVLAAQSATAQAITETAQADAATAQSITETAQANAATERAERLTVEAQQTAQAKTATAESWTDTPTPTATATNTFTPSPTATDTATRIPSRTPTPERTSEVLGNRVNVFWQDDFERNRLNVRWQRNISGNLLQLANGDVIFEGANRWGNTLALRSIQEGEGILVEFRVPDIGDLELYLENGEPFGSTGYRRWGIGNYDNRWGMTCYGTLLCNNVDQFFLIRGRTYYLLLRASDNGTMHAQIWQQENPTRYVLNVERAMTVSGWRDADWTFVIQVHSGVLALESVEELHFPARYRMPANPPGYQAPPTPTRQIPTGTPIPPTAIPPANGTGLLGQYYNTISLTGSPRERIDDRIFFRWGPASPMTGIGAETFSVRWSGQIVPRFTDTYTFSTISDDGVRIYIDGTLVLNAWFDQDGTTERRSRGVDLVAGRRYDIVVEYFENSGDATMELRWQSRYQTRQVIPARQLFPERAARAAAIPTAVQTASQNAASAFLSVLVEADFETSMLQVIDNEGWIVNRAEGIYCRSAPGNSYPLFRFGERTWRDYSVEARIRLTRTSGDLHSAIITRTDFSGNGYRHALSGRGSGGWASHYDCCDGRTDEGANGGTITALYNDTWYTLRAEVDGNYIRTYVDGRLVANTTSTSRRLGLVSVEAGPFTGVCVDDIIVRSLDRSDEALAAAQRVTATASVNVRSGPGTDFSRISTLSTGQEVFVMERDGDWVLIRRDDNGIQGWVAAEFLTNN